MIVKIFVTPRKGILDPQGRATEGALKSLGFKETKSVHVGHYVVIDLDSPSRDAAAATAHRMCEQLLANPLIEDYRIEVDDG